jgi:hypothetical protein
VEFWNDGVDAGILKQSFFGSDAATGSERSSPFLNTMLKHPMPWRVVEA